MAVKRIEDMTDAEIRERIDRVIANNLAEILHPKPKFVQSERVEDDRADE